MNTRRSATRRSSSRSPRTSQRRSPPSTIAATIARSRWVRNAAVSASTSAGVRIRGSRPGPSRQRHPVAGTQPLAAGRQPTRHRVRGDVAAGLQVGEEPRDHRQPPRHRAGRHPAVLARGGWHRLQPADASVRPVRCAVMNPSTSAGSPRPAACRRRRRTPADPTPPPAPCSVGTDPPGTPDSHRPTASRAGPPAHQARRSSRTDQTRIGQGHPETSSYIDRQPQRLVEMS